MGGEKRSVRRGGSDIAARTAATLNWIAIGGLVFAAASGVVAVRPVAQLEPVSREVATLQVPPSGASVNSFTEALSATGTGETRSEAQEASAVSDVPMELSLTQDVQTAAAPKEKTRRVRHAAESKPPEKAPEGNVGSALQTTASAPVESNTAWSEGEIRAAREECAALLGNLPAEWSVAPPMRAMTCGTPGPITLSSVGAAKVALVPAATTNCSTAAALSRWMDQHVQPAAVKHFGVPVARVTIATSYDCRNRYGQKQAPLSEHALANALDLSSFKLTDGRTVTVLGGWGPTARGTQVAPVQTAGAAKTDSKVSPVRQQERMGLGAQSLDVSNAARAKVGAVTTVSTAIAKGPEAEFLRSVHSSACTVFGTVLGPEANEAHRDHFHLDMKYRRRNSFCQ